MVGVLALLVAALLGNGRFYTISPVGASLGPALASPTTSAARVQSTPTQPDNPTATAPPATPTTVVTYCTHLPGFAEKAQPATGGPDFEDVPFPPSSLSYVASTFSDGAYHFTLVSVCSPDLSSANVRSYFAAAMPDNGWTQSSLYPYAGNPSRACGDAYCWTKGSGPIRYASLEAVKQGASGVTYQLRLGIHS